MPYQIQTPAYPDIESRLAHSYGYNDGYDCRSQQRSEYPQPYSRGYWEGFADSPFKGDFSDGPAEYPQWMRELHSPTRPFPLFKWIGWGVGLAALAGLLFWFYSV